MTTRYLMSDRKEKAMNRFSAGGYKKGGHVTEIAIMMGSPKGMKKSGMGRHKSPMRKTFGGPMDAEAPQVEQNIDQANQMLQKGIGLKKGGTARPCHFKHRTCKADGGPIGLTQMANRDFKSGKNAVGLKKGGTTKCGSSKNPIRKANGGFFNGISNVINDRPWSAAPQNRAVLQNTAAPIQATPDVRMAAGGIGKIRKHVVSKAGKPLPISFAKKHARDL